MKNLKEIINLNCWVIICFMLLSATETKAQVKKMTAKDMTDVSAAVLYGKCKSKRCEWNENKSAIYTYITIVPEEYIKGNLGTEVVVAVPGGRVDNMLYEVSETPFFTEDEEVVAFIWTSPKGKHLITGGFQGKMKIEKDAKTGKRFVNDPDGDSETLTQNLAPGQIKKAVRMQLEDYVVKLKGYMKH
jgi:thiamine pyrophosphokinase